LHYCDILYSCCFLRCIHELIKFNSMSLDLSTML
jgi:hypothetical protein